MLIRAAALAFALLLPVAAVAAPSPQPSPAPREVVGRAAKAIEDLYFDPARAKVIAADLRKEAAAGKYDALTDPRDLATALSERLRPLDHHFGVSFQPPGPDTAGAAPGAGGPPAVGPGPAPGGPPPGPSAEDEAFERRANYGFRKVEILPGGVGFIDMSQFSDLQPGSQPAREAVDAALTLVSGADAVIIDLRDNGGGSPAMVGYLVSAFTPRDADIYNVFHSREGTQSEAPETYYAHPRLDVPLYILVSGRTGSAAEALPYTLQAARRATIVGETTGGAANPGGSAPLGGGFSIFISRGAPINAVTKTNWEGTGVKPDVAVPAAQALDRARTLALEAILARVPDSPTAKDSRWALEAIKAQANPPAVVRADYLGAYGPITVLERDERLILQRGTRPPRVLLPLGGDSFFIETDPSLRVVFERDAAGKIAAFGMDSSSGPGGRYRRDPAPSAR